ncbi:GtrA family protein [Sandarakinorhabdus sp. DWP1-3-1]|uniref:GtrA family protein n=1 Tax=Sandarakinorhabdus sp. DWP1-3-1 TaxID=2804627 RepID=UPI003CF6CC6E
MRFVRFLIVGVLNSAVGLALIYAAMALGADYRVANAIGYAGGILISFVVNRGWTFAHDGDWRASFARWLVVVGVAYAAQFAAVVWLHGLGVDARIAQALGVPIYTVLAFLGARRFAFPDRAAG